MNIDCCKSYVGKQIIGLLPGGAEECLYVLVINAQDYGGDTNFVGWTLNGNDFLTEIQNYVDSGTNYNNDQGSQSYYGYYTGTTPTDLNITTNYSGEILFTITKVTDYEGASCDLVCYQASFDYGFEWRFIDFFSAAPASPYIFPSAYNIDDATNLQYFASGFLGPQITVTSVWNGSQYVVTINNAFNLGGFSLGDSNPVYYPFTALPCEIVPPEPVPLALLNAYPNAGAAYSVRKLSSSYTGSALRVRRSSDNTEQDIGFVGLDLDTTALSSFVGANNGFVTKWYDQSGNSRDMVQATAANQMRIVNAGVIETSGGKPSIRSLKNTANYMDNNLSTLQGLPVSIYTCFELIDLSTNGFGNVSFIYCGNNGVINGRYRLGVSNTNYITQRLNNVTQNNDSFSAKRNIFSNLFRASQLDTIQNTSNYIGTSYSGTVFNTASNFRIGALAAIPDYFAAGGKYQEFIIYLSDQDSNNTGIRTNINSYYSVY